MPAGYDMFQTVFNQMLQHEAKMRPSAEDAAAQFEEICTQLARGS